MPTVSEAFAIAVKHHQAGELQAAERIYREILAIDPNHADALHLLGVIALQAGQHESAIECISRAIELNGSNPAFQSNLGSVYQARGKLEEAGACFCRALELAPELGEGHCNLGTVWEAQGRLNEAVESYRRAIALKPDLVEAHNNLGNALHAQGQLDEAIDCFRRTLELSPDHAEALSNLGNVLREQERLDEAIECCRRAIALKPDLAEAHSNLGAALQGRGELGEALACFEKALTLKPDYAEAECNRGTVFHEQENLDEAVVCYRRAIEMQPGYAQAHNNLGNALKDLGRLEEAVACYGRALELQPHFAEAHSNLGSALKQLRRFDEAVISYGRALELEPGYAYAYFGLATLKLLRGDFERGWREYEFRWKTGDLEPRKFSQPRWDGEPLKGRTILLHAEQGLGDTVQFVRYAGVVKKQNVEASVVVECQRPLTKLLAACPGIDRLVARGDVLPPFDLQAPLASMPEILGTTLDTIPAETPYLFADAALVDAWRARLEPVRGLRIGINWRGRPKTRHRDVPVQCFGLLAEVPGVRLISLQKGAARENFLAEDGKRPCIVDLGDFDATGGAFVDSAAIMMNLDLVISSDTAAPHLAGALGVPVWLALPFVPDWRWLLDRTDSPWYPTMRIFRQKAPGDWAGVFEEIRSELRKLILGASERGL